MSIKEPQGLGGRLQIELRDPQGRLLQCRRHDNLITRAGRRLVARYFTGAVQARPELFIAVGGSDEAPRDEDTALKQELDRVAATPSPVQPGEGEEAARMLARVSATLDSGVTEPQELREAGIVIKVPDQPDVLYNRVTFPLVTRTGNIQMTLTWEVIF